MSKSRIQCIRMEGATDTEQSNTSQIVPAAANQTTKLHRTCTYHSRRCTEVWARNDPAPKVILNVGACAQLQCHDTSTVKHGSSNAETRTFVWRRASASPTPPVIVGSSLPLVISPRPIPVVRIPISPVWVLRIAPFRVRRARRKGASVRRARTRPATRRWRRWRRISRVPSRHVQRKTEAKAEEGEKRERVERRLIMYSCKRERRALWKHRPLEIATQRRAPCSRCSLRRCSVCSRCLTHGRHFASAYGQLSSSDSKLSRD